MRANSAAAGYTSGAPPRDVFALASVAEIGEFFTAHEFSRLGKHVMRKFRGGVIRSMEGDGQVEGAPCEYADPVAEQLLASKTPHLANLLGLDLLPAYSYVRIYRPGDRLPAHRDRAACEITVSAPLGSGPRWPLRMLLEGGVAEFCPAPRAAVAFKGHHILHWRDPLPGRVPAAQILFHYVQRDGAHASWAYDRRD